MRLTLGITCGAALLIGSVVAPLGAQDGQGRGRGGAPGGGGGRGFPAQQRQLADQATRDRGKLLYEINCRSCLGACVPVPERGLSSV